MKAWNELASDETISKTAMALEQNGVEVFVAENREKAKQKANELIPKGSEVMVMTSETLRVLGLEKELQESSEYDAVKPRLAKMDDTQAREKKRLGSAASISIGSVHAVTEDGKILIASNTGSQLPGYAYGSDKVIWMVGAQKLVANTDEGIKRIYNYVLPLESARARKAYNLPDTWSSFVSKLLIFNREATKDRVKMIIVKEPLGF